MAEPVTVDTTGFQLYPHIVGDDEEETALLRKDAEEALRYIRSFKWTPPIKRLYLAWGIGKVLCLFLVQFERRIAGNPDDQLWIIMGDLPPAYLVVDSDAPDPQSVLRFYCELMDDWADTALAGKNMSHCYPVNVAPTEEYARMLKSRIDTVRVDFIPNAWQFIGGRNHEAAEPDVEH